MSKTRAKAHLFSTGILNEEPDSLQGYYAGFTSRAVAIIVDLAIISLVSAVVIGGVSLFLDLPSIKRFIFWLNSVLPGIAQVFVWLTGPGFAGVFYFLFLYLYFIFFFSTTGQTVGKAIMGLRVVTTDGKRMGVRRSFIRTLCYTLSLAPLGLGFLWVLGEDRRRSDARAGPLDLHGAELRAHHRSECGKGAIAPVVICPLPFVIWTKDKEQRTKHVAVATTKIRGWHLVLCVVLRHCWAPRILRRARPRHQPWLPDRADRANTADMAFRHTHQSLSQER